MNVFYVSHINPSGSILIDDDFKHCCHVLRYKEGQKIHITDGKGQEAEAIIEKIEKKSAALSIINLVNHDASNNPITIAIAPPKNRNRWEWFIEKSVEIGIDTIIPMQSKNSERQKINIERAEKIIKSAALQSKRWHHPKIQAVKKLESIFESHHNKNINKFLSHYKPNNTHLKDETLTNTPSIILIGPEGDFNNDEIQSGIDAGFKIVNISKNRLRTETAGIVALNLLVNL